MKKLIAMVVFLAACGGHAKPNVNPTSSATGGADPRAALAGFMAAARTQDIQALGAYWGTKDGSVRESGVISRDQLERRELIMLCYLKHESYRVITEASAPNDERAFAVQLNRGSLSRTTTAYAVKGPNDRWYIRSVDIEPLRDLCAT